MMIRFSSYFGLDSSIRKGHTEGGGGIAGCCGRCQSIDTSSLKLAVQIT